MLTLKNWTITPDEELHQNSCTMQCPHVSVSVCVQVPHETGGSAIHVKCTWSNTGNTIQALSMDEDDEADFTFDSMDEEDEHEVDHSTCCHWL